MLPISPLPDVGAALVPPTGAAFVPPPDGATYGRSAPAVVGVVGVGAGAVGVVVFGFPSGSTTSFPL